jgi:hypothetical protein
VAKSATLAIPAAADLNPFAKVPKNPPGLTGSLHSIAESSNKIAEALNFIFNQLN